MADISERPSSAGPKRRGPVAFAVLVVVAVGLWAAWSPRRPSPGLTEVTSAYLNARPRVRYVGDASCVKCHADIAKTYRGHGMGRSLAPITSASADLRGGETDGVRELFEAQGYRYSVERRGDRTFHRETRNDGAGRVVAETEGEVRFVLGSGSHAQAFLIDRGGYLFESPVTWYAQKARWGLSPGFADKPGRFERQVTTDCLFCHANRVEHVPGTENQYKEPVFQGHSIGCERCHGPGELHAREPTPLAGSGPNIVNPSALEPALREDVCQQCHLLGEKAVARAGRALSDYRPGLSLPTFQTVFVQPPGPTRDHRNAGHVEQMVQSVCYKASRGKLGCVSCHDPHRKIAQAEKPAFYRDRCLTCHTDQSCGLPVTKRRETSAGDSCVACHMPSASTSDIPHVATTVHSIPRKILKRNPEDGPESDDFVPLPDDARLVPFHDARLSAKGREAVKRDLGVALRTKGPRGAAEALPLLESALAAGPGDLVARESLGYVLGTLNRGDEGLSAFEAVLRESPGRESTLAAAALLASRLGRRGESIAYWKRAIAVDPWRSDYHAGLASQLALEGSWDDAVGASRRALELNPASVQARMVLIESAVHARAPVQARTEFNTLLEFAPRERATLTRWFDGLR